MHLAQMLQLATQRQMLHCSQFPSNVAGKQMALALAHLSQAVEAVNEPEDDYILHAAQHLLGGLASAMPGKRRWRLTWMPAAGACVRSSSALA